MLNIEKYKDEIKAEINKDKTLGCVVNKLMGNTCDNYPKCNDCYLKVLDWLLQEHEEPTILTDKEKVIIKDIIKAFEPFGGELEYIVKGSWGAKEHECYINFSYKNNATVSPAFNEIKLFKNMELNRQYSLEELGL